ncbi:MAG: hypothetical protein IJZ32_04525 [Clostridia bacterium]|nr:hypothetical protein [Clostridia bacterium]
MWIKKVFWTIIVLLLILALVGCWIFREMMKGYEHPKFKTKYTIEEHIKRLTTRTEEKYAKELENGELLDFRVEILYAFYDNDPEYFLIEYRFADTIDKIYGEDGIKEVRIENHGHLIGMIENDKYKVRFLCCRDEDEWGDYHTRGYDEEILVGQSCYTKCGFENTKKYYGGHTCAVELDGQIVQIYNNDGYPDEARWERRVISESEQKRLMKQSYHMGADIY